MHRAAGRWLRTGQPAGGDEHARDRLAGGQPSGQRTPAASTAKPIPADGTGPLAGRAASVGRPGATAAGALRPQPATPDTRFTRMPIAYQACRMLAKEGEGGDGQGRRGQEQAQASKHDPAAPVSDRAVAGTP